MRLAERALRPLERTHLLLGALVVVQWVVVAAIGLSARHNGWLWYQGGDHTYYYTTSWLLGEGLLPPTPIGYGWSLLTAPVSMIAGGSVLDALPLIVVGQFLLLLPIGLVAVWAIGESCGGRPLATSASVLWATLPALSIPLFAERWHPVYVDTVLPQLLGLTNLADFPSTIALLVSAAFVLKGIDRRSNELVLLSALAAGFAIGIKPANLVFLAAPFLALALARRPAQLLVYGAGLVPALATLALWKQRGLGNLPAFARPETVLTGGTDLLAADRFLYERYLDVDWHHLWANLLQLQEVFWGLRVLEWFLLAGLFAVARHSIPKGAFLAAWLGAYIVFKGASGAAVVEQGSFFRLVQPGLPSAVILGAATVLLVPAVARRARETQWLGRAPGRRTVTTGILLLGVVPLLLIAGVRPLQERRAAIYPNESLFVPVNAFPLHTSRDGSRVVLQWRPSTSSPRTFYRVLRADAAAGTGQAEARQGLECSTGDLPASCGIRGEVVATTRGMIYVDRPPPGTWTYRITISANASDSLAEGGVVLVSDAAVVRVP